MFLRNISRFSLLIQDIIVIPCQTLVFSHSLILTKFYPFPNGGVFIEYFWRKIFACLKIRIRKSVNTGIDNKVTEFFWFICFFFFKLPARFYLDAYFTVKCKVALTWAHVRYSYLDFHWNSKRLEVKLSIVICEHMYAQSGKSYICTTFHLLLDYHYWIRY